MYGGLQMKLPEERHPTLFALLVIPIVLVSGVIVKADTPLEYPVGLLALFAGFLGGALLMLVNRLTEIGGAEQYLRDQLKGRLRLRPYWWAMVLAWTQFWTVMWFIQQTSGHAVLWYWYGALWGLLVVGYPLARAHWKRLQRFAEEETQAASA